MPGKPAMPNELDQHAKRDPVWDEGFRAGWRSEPYETNPYQNGADREAWFGGWMAGLNEKLQWPTGTGGSNA